MAGLISTPDSFRWIFGLNPLYADPYRKPISLLIYPTNRVAKIPLIFLFGSPLLENNSTNIQVTKHLLKHL